jgi:hypothetical protein
VRSIRDQCQVSGTPYFFKQGEWGPVPWRADREPGQSDTDYKKRAGRLLDGRTWDEFPQATGGNAGMSGAASRVPQRVRVTGDLFHGHVPVGAVYVGRAAPGLPASPFASPFPLRKKFHRQHPLRPFLDAAITGACPAPAPRPGLAHPCHDVLIPGTPAVAVAAYRLWLATQPALIDAARTELAGRDIACWCPPPAPGQPDLCHGAVLLTVASQHSISSTDKEN